VVNTGLFFGIERLIRVEKFLTLERTTKEPALL
jgi:hypothetical protein